MLSREGFSALFGWRSRSLTFRFGLQAGAALLLVALISGLIRMQSERKGLFEEAEGQAMRKAELLAAMTANPLFSFDYTALDAVIQAFTKDAAVGLLEIKDKSGKVIKTAGGSKESKGLILASQQVKAGNDTVGSVTLGFTTDALDQAMRKSWQVLALREGIGLMLIFPILAFLVRREVSRPLQQVNQILWSVQESGDLTLRLEGQRTEEIEGLAKRFNSLMDTLQGLLLEMSRAASGVASASQHLSSASHQLSSGAQEQASSLEQTAASLEEITDAVKQTADNARQANQLAMGSRDAAEKGGGVVTAAVNSMGEINKASKKIADIITAIDEIAFQTNLLALNAAVEAARAGEQGRGFAVVAAEVRNLAQRSATAAKEIKSLIQDSVHKVEAGSELVNRSGKTLEEIVTSVKRVTDIIGEIAAAGQEQSSGIDLVNKAVTQMDQITQSNAAQTEELSSTAQSMAVQAEQLQALVARFKLDKDGVGSMVASSHAVKAMAKPAMKSMVSKIEPRKSKPVAHAPHGGNGPSHPSHSSNSSPKVAESGFEEF